MSQSESPVTLDIERPQSYNRLEVLLRMFIIAPHLIVFFFLGGLQIMVTLVAWIAILSSGKYPEGLYAISLRIFRWWVRLFAYFHLLSDDYPALAPEEALDKSQAGELQRT